MRRALTGWLTALVLLPLAGCAAGVPCHYFGRFGDAEPALPEVKRGKLAKEFDDNLAQVKHERTTDVPAYRSLSAFECQCLSAGAASIANLLDEARYSQPAPGKRPEHRKQKQADMRNDILFYAALDARNKQAGGGLEAYYRLAEAEARIELLLETIDFLKDANRKTKDLVRQGILSSQDYEDVVRRQLEAQANLVELELAVEKLNAELKYLMGMSPAPRPVPGEEIRLAHNEVAGPSACGAPGLVLVDNPWRVRPSLEGDGVGGTVDLHEAVRTGLMYRPDLNLLQTVARDLDRDTMAVVRGLVRTFSALLVKDPVKANPLLRIIQVLKGALQIELAEMRAQIESQLRERERQVLNEIKQAVVEVNARAELAVLARRQVASRLSTVQDVEARAKRGLIGFKTVIDARLGWLRARSEAVVAVSRQQVAGAKLRQAQGILALECGFGMAGEEACAPLPPEPTSIDCLRDFVGVPTSADEPDIMPRLPEEKAPVPEPVEKIPAAPAFLPETQEGPSIGRD